MRGIDDFEHNFISNVVTVNLNVLYILIKGEIVGNEDSGLIITIHEY